MRIVFIGTGEIGLPTLRALCESREHELVALVTQPDKPVGRDQRITPPPVKTALRDSIIPIFQPKRIKAEEAVSEIRALNPDLIIVMAYGQILPRSLLEVPSVACLNLHASLLPRWRGAAPIQAAIAAGDRETGITVIYMGEGLDTGEILLQRKIGIAPDETGSALHDKLAQIAPLALSDALRLLAKGNAPRLPQDEKFATYAPKLEREHGCIHWNEPAEVIERKIRAYNPWPGSFTQVWDKRNNRQRALKIFRAVVIPDVQREPGTIIPARDREIVFATENGALAVLEAQLEGSRRMTAEELLRGHPWIAHL